MSKYRIYIDEVGNPDLESSENPNHRFLSLTGIIADLDYVRTTIQPELEALKESLFLSHPDDPVVLHRKELLGGKPQTANVACLQIADLIAHPSRNEVLIENGHDTLIRLAPFGSQIVELIQSKYYQKEGNIYGKKYL